MHGSDSYLLHAIHLGTSDPHTMFLLNRAGRFPDYIMGFVRALSPLWPQPPHHTPALGPPPPYMGVIFSPTWYWLRLFLPTPCQWCSVRPQAMLVWISFFVSRVLFCHSGDTYADKNEHICTYILSHINSEVIAYKIAAKRTLMISHNFIFSQSVYQYPFFIVAHNNKHRPTFVISHDFKFSQSTRWFKKNGPKFQ